MVNISPMWSIVRSSTCAGAVAAATATLGFGMADFYRSPSMIDVQISRRCHDICIYPHPPSSNCLLFLFSRVLFPAQKPRHQGCGGRHAIYGSGRQDEGASNNAGRYGPPVEGGEGEECMN
ncbi:unnamed protein product [Schistocephalus solidus]|uniref:Secreted protein n=1 Tax=Schistocephalus solidus TaxID=70667 RepID=A0A183SFK9_SCHSO|nr:unnamed protein product [Schistocephalus solidus]